jgi:hypothetical protein
VTSELTLYAKLLADIKARMQAAWTACWPLCGRTRSRGSFRHRLWRNLGGAPSLRPVVKTTADSRVWQLPLGHHALMLEKVKPVEDRRQEIAQTLI